MSDHVPDPISIETAMLVLGVCLGFALTMAGFAIVFLVVGKGA